MRLGRLDSSFHCCRSISNEKLSDIMNVGLPVDHEYTLYASERIAAQEIAGAQMGKVFLRLSCSRSTDLDNFSSSGAG